MEVGGWGSGGGKEEGEMINELATVLNGLCDDASDHTLLNQLNFYAALIYMHILCSVQYIHIPVNVLAMTHISEGRVQFLWFPLQCLIRMSTGIRYVV